MGMKKLSCACFNTNISYGKRLNGGTAPPLKIRPGETGPPHTGGIVPPLKMYPGGTVPPLKCTLQDPINVCFIFPSGQ